MRIGVLFGVALIEQIVDSGAQHSAGILIFVAVVAGGPGINTNTRQVSLCNATPRERSQEAGIRPDRFLCGKKLFKDDAWLPLNALPRGHYLLSQVNNCLVGAALTWCLVEQQEKDLARNCVVGMAGKRYFGRRLVQAHHYEADMFRVCLLRLDNRDCSRDFFWRERSKWMAGGSSRCSHRSFLHSF